jgi:DNA-binding NarL/FixJ family response regulator
MSFMPPESDTRVVLADYLGPGRAAIAALLDRLPGATVVGDVADPAEILPTVRATRPDVVIVDDRLLRHERWTADDLAARLIVVGMDDDPGYRSRAERFGAEAWIAKERADVVLPVLLSQRGAIIPQS